MNSCSTFGYPLGTCTCPLLQLDGGLLEAVRAVTVVLGPFLGVMTTLFLPELKV